MLVTLLPIVTDVRPEQLWKAEEPMLVTLSGIEMDVRPEQFWKAYLPMLVTLLGITVFLHPAINILEAVSTIALQPFLLSYTLLLESTEIYSKLGQ
jgi:hypothetical protein